MAEMLNNMSKAVFNNAQFTQINHATSPPAPDVPRILESIAKDAKLNGYHAGVSSIKVAHFTFDILSSLPAIDNNPLIGSSRSTLTSYGSCSFDLAERLELLPHQTNGVLLHTVEIPLDQLGCYNGRYCGYISRHGLIFIASRYAQRIHATPDVATVVESSIGRFKVFEHDHRLYAHFDRDIRMASTLDGKWDTHFNLHQVQSYARGQYFVKNAFGLKSDAAFWKTLDYPVIDLAMKNVIQDTDCRVFLLHDVMAEWELVRRFGRDMMQAVKRMFFAVQKPEAVRRSLDVILKKSQDEATLLMGGATTLFAGGEDATPEDSIAMAGYLMHFHGGGPKNLEFTATIPPSYIQAFFINNLGMLCKGHSTLRSAAINLDKIVKTSETRFLDLFKSYRAHVSPNRLEEELQALLHNPNNICLVLWQGWLGMLVYYNSCRVRRLGIEATEEWMQFILAQDSDLLLGAM